jgi:4-amino-4-deoxy-L-arabinose transferase-like glycosyltransferase
VKSALVGFLSKWWGYLVLAALIYMPVFGNLDVQPIREYDEGRIAANAYEMFHTGRLFVITYEYEPEMWNTKPAFLIWCQALLMHIVGVNELAIRLPSAFAALFTCLAMLVFCSRALKQFMTGFIAVLVLITTYGYIHDHFSRTGDYDALLVFFTTTSSLLFFSYCETGRSKLLYGFFVCLACGVLTKAIAGLMFCPALLIYSITAGKFTGITRNKHFIYGLGIFVFLVAGYFLMRESQNPGFFEQMKQNDMGGRFMNKYSPTDFGYYLDMLMRKQMADRYLLIPCGLLLGLFSRNALVKRFSLFLTLATVSYFLIISLAQTRLEQYVAPLFPLFSLAIAIAVHQAFEGLRRLKPATHAFRVNVLPGVLLFVLFAVPYSRVFAKTYWPAEDDPWENEAYEIGYMLRETVRGHYDVNNRNLLFDGYNAHLRFYIYALQENGVRTGIRIMQELNPGDRVFAVQMHVKQFIRDHFRYEERCLRGNVCAFDLGERKPAVTDTSSATPRLHPHS